MFSVRKQVTVCILATVSVQLCCIIPVLANSRPLSLIGEEPVQPQQPVSALPPRPLGGPLAPRARPQPRRRPKPRPSRPILPGFQDTLCVGSDFITNRKLKDEKYMRQQLDCALERGPCDDTGKMIKRLAPDVLKGHCPSPCTMCTRRQIKRVMAEVQKKFPREFSEMLRSFSQRS
jgi:hypothetical protein